jgi:hypothetical protein
MTLEFVGAIGTQDGSEGRCARQREAGDGPHRVTSPRFNSK